jgi:hypothetical protein
MNRSRVSALRETVFVHEVSGGDMQFAPMRQLDSCGCNRSDAWE